MKTVLARCAALSLLLVPALLSAQETYVGYKYIPGDTAWYQTHVVMSTAVTVVGGRTTTTRMEQTVSHHQYVISHSDSAVVMVIQYDAIKVGFGKTDSVLISYDSKIPADSVNAYNAIVYPLKALLGHKMTVYINAQGAIDSIQGIDVIFHDASLMLTRSAQIAQLRQSLNATMIADLLEQSLGNLPNKSMTPGTSTKSARARMVGLTQFRDEVVTQLVRVTGDTATISRAIYTQIASPTINYSGKLCIVDSTYGAGDQMMSFDVHHGVITNSNETFSNYFRAAVQGTPTVIIQQDELSSDVRMTRYAEKKIKTKSKK